MKDANCTCRGATNYNCPLHGAADESPKQAVISSCGRYRYRLTRLLETGEGTIVFIMLNPSTADAAQDDPTIRKCVGFAKKLGRQCVEVVNLFAWRATDPKELMRQAAHHDIVGPENDWFVIQEALSRDALFVAAWGGHARSYPQRVRDVIKLLRYAKPVCLGYTKDRHPRHPLMLPYATELEAYRPETGI